MPSSLPSRIACVAALWCLGASYPVFSKALPQPSPGSTDAQAEASQDQGSRPSPSDNVIIPGPLRSFLRMAGLSQEISPEDVLPNLAHNVALYGYENGKETEYLRLVNRYVHLAQELQQMAGEERAIHISGCADAARLLHAIGYKLQNGCGDGNTSLITEDAERAFLTVDSGFPLTALEEALQRNGPFTYSFRATRVPVFSTERNWTAASTWKKQSGGSLLDALLHDQNLDRLYWALAKCDRQTRFALIQSPGLKKLMPLANVMEAYGSGIRIRSGSVIVAAGTQKSWEDLAGAKTDAAGEFVIHLLARDQGWLAAYFDALSRLSQQQQAHLADGARLQHLYSAYRSTAPNNGAGEGVFPRNSDLLILLSSVKWDASGDPQVLGGSEVWQDILSQKSKPSGMRLWAKRGHCCDSPEHLLETLVAASNVYSESGPTQIFLMLNALNAGRPAGQNLSVETEKLVANRVSQFSRWFPVFAEFPDLDDTSISRFVAAADHVDGISGPALRANALGALQADVGLWQILARQGQIPRQQLNSSWLSAIQPFIGVSSSVQLFEAARTSLQSTLLAASGNANLSQDQIVDLLTGPRQDSPEGKGVHRELAAKMQSVLDDQRLATLDTLFGLYDGLTEMAHGAAVGSSLLPLAENLREFEMPRAIFTGTEKVAWSPVVYTSRHAELQVRTDLTKILRSPGSPAQLEAARGQLTPFLRDTLVGLNYAYYEPPGAEVLHNNPLFVRSHDFSSVSVQGVEQIWGPPNLIGVGATAGGGAYLMGSLADLPYALASAEEDFIAPKNVQALIWKEAAPELLVGAILPRWWNVSRNELHSAALYQRMGEELLASSATNADVKAEVIEILSDRMTSDQMERAEEALQSPESAAALVSQAFPSDMFSLGVEFRKEHPEEASKLSAASRELDDLAAKNPSDVNPERLASDFGVPHPVLELTDTCTLLNMKPAPAFGGDASRLLGESWESNNLYWARIADEMGYPPVMLNVLVPVLTRHMVANIFASNLDDWPALLRAMRETGDEFRKGKIVVQTANTIASE